MMKKVLIGILLTLSLVACSAGGLNSQNQPTQGLTVTGNGKVYLTPDIAYIYIGVRTQSNDVAESLAQNSTQARKVADILKELGVAEKDIQTTSFNVYPQQEFGPDGQPTKMNYVVENTVYVTVRDLQSLGKLLDAVVRSGANSINGIRFDVEDKDKAQQEARRLALEDAKAQAEEIAAAAGVKLGRVLTLSVNLNYQPAMMFDSKGGAMTSSSGEAPMASGQLMVTADAYLTYEMK